VTSEADPFPGWVWIGEEPADGFVFHFSEDDDFVIGRGAERDTHLGRDPLPPRDDDDGRDAGHPHRSDVEVQVDPIRVPILHVPFAAVVTRRPHL